MNPLFRPLLIGSLFVAALAPAWVLGQNPVTPSRRVLNPVAPGSQAGSGNREATLSSNYTITLTVLFEDKPVGEVVVLTASPRVQTNVPLNGKDMPSAVSAQGELTEGEDGKLNFVYSLGFSVPVVTRINAPPGSGAPGPGNTQYQNHSSVGSVLAKPGKPYDLLKASGYVYRVVIDKAKD